MYKIGIGFDIHRFDENRELIIGGVSIPYKYGLSGHSDADVLIHSICDALLGALGSSDIGTHFPNDDPEYKDKSSLFFLEKISDMLRSSGFKIVNIDSVIISEQPKFLLHIDNMKIKISETLEIDKKNIGIKATTSEGIGCIGREEGIAAKAIVLIEN